MLRCSAWAEARAAPRRGALCRVEIVCESRFIKVGHEPASCATCADQVYGFRSGPGPDADFRCVHAPLAQRRPRRGAAPTVQIYWLQYSGESLYIKVGHETKFSKWARPTFPTRDKCVVWLLADGLLPVSCVTCLDRVHCGRSGSVPSD